ncbi:MAG: DUF3035 domain-containing protein [Paracoccaceae bacterium]|nr:DUF3035 domain-containing protein [Paracoccaceae bacterium]MDE3122823.1 DUF3035 domain-containing protein [Paracoccaceae bacterium]MDE3238095.1 DUF3035 domain-containing protein [Paracoccaceae bacterium]
MRAGQGIFGIALVAVLALAGCSGSSTPHLMNLRANATSPDEFAILPTKPLQMPKDMSALPQPTPGGTNLADPTPLADAVTALGGKAAAMTAQGIPVADGALVNAASRYGNDPNIRQQLDAADLRFRRTHNGRVLDRLFGHTVYFQAYAPMSLDQYAELEKWRAMGVATPSAPPKPVK